MLPATYILIPMCHSIADYEDYIEIPLTQVIQKIWDFHEGIRLTNIVMQMPDLLMEEEAELWHYILTRSYFWAHYPVIVVDAEGQTIKESWQPIISPTGLIHEYLLEHWLDILDYKQHEDGEMPDLSHIPQKLGKKIARPDDLLSEISELNFDEEISLDRKYLQN